MKKFTTVLPLLIAAAALMIARGAVIRVQQVGAQIEDVTNYNGVHLSQSTFGTATPQLLIQNSGSANSLEIRDGSATPMVSVDADGNAVFAGEVDLSGATVSGVSTSTLSSLTVTGNTVLSGTLVTSSTVDFNDDLDMNNEPIVNIGAAGTDFGTDGGLTLAAGLTVSAGNTDLAGTLQFGAANLYPLGYASANQQVVCGTTTFTETSKVTPTGLTTVTYVLAAQVTTPAATGAFLTVSDPTTSTFNIYSWEADYSEGTTPVAAHWCAVGDQ